MDVSETSRYLNPDFKSKNDLLQESSEHLSQMLGIAQKSHEDVEVRVFCSHVALHCLRLRNYIEHSRQDVDPPNGEAIDDALRHLSSLIAESGLQELQESITTTERRLRALESQWNAVRRLNDDKKATFIRRVLKLDMGKEWRTQLDTALEVCADDLDKATCEHPSKEHKDTRIVPSITEHSEGISKAAQSVFNALHSNNSCSCTDAHEVKAKLQLGTYKVPGEVTKCRSRKRKRDTILEDELVDELQFDMFLSTGNDWKEVCVRSVKETIVRFSLPSEEPSSSRSDSTRERKEVESLCKTVSKVKSKNLRRLELRLTGGKLLESGLEKSNFLIDNVVQPISLSQCLEERRDFFTEKTKRILSLILGYMVLRLNNTSWLKPGWSSASIQFFQTISRKTPLRPFIQSQLPKVYPSGEGPDSQSVSVNKSSDADSLLKSDHPYPGLVALAVVLIELHFGMTFRKLADMHQIPIDEESEGRIFVVDVDLVLDGDEDSKLDGWRSQIPQNIPLLTAIDNCLDKELWQDDNGATLTSSIYQHIVRHLELYLTDGFGNIPLDEIDKYARSIDLGNWGQSIARRLDQDANSVGPAVLASSHGLPLPLAPCTVGQENFHTKRVRVSEDSRFCSDSPPSVMEINNASISKSQLGTCRFFDDVAIGKDAVIQSSRYRAWKSKYDRVYEKFVGCQNARPPPTPVKVAILDTGIDREHEHIEARDMNLKETRNCHDESQEDVADQNGHGTFAASLILDYAKDVELYVIKITDENSIPDAKIVAKAINYALDKWHVDIISMSFGWPSRKFDSNKDLEEAIFKAYTRSVLMFAAADNSGGNRDRAYPASNPHVICVYSTDTLGNRSDFSPTAVRGRPNIATVGESVQSAWPPMLCQAGEYVKTRSGTSYATPIIVGVSAFLLHFARMHLPIKEATRLKQKHLMEALLERCAKHGSDYQPRDEYNYVVLSLDDGNLFGQDLRRVRDEFMEILET